MKKTLCLLPLALLAAFHAAGADDDSANLGYYRFPALYGDQIVFTAEGDLWKVGTRGGVAQRLTSHAGEEAHAAFSPDGKTLAFSAEYEGPMEVYTMPVAGGLPVRRTFDGEVALVAGWTPDGKIMYATRHYSTLPNWQLATADPANGAIELLPLNQADEGSFDGESKTLFFTRMHFQGSHTKRYKGGTAQNLWKYTSGEVEAAPLTADFAGTSKNPMFWSGRVYFLTDRDGTMNIWSMNTEGAELRQHTFHKGWDVKSASLSDGRIVYQLGADLWLLNINGKEDNKVAISLASDFDQEREKWLKNPADYLTSASLSPDGDRIVLTARGQVFVAPVKEGRFVDVTKSAHVRYRQGTFLPDGKSLIAFSDESGELELQKLPANGVGKSEQITHDGKVFRYDAVPSPDGKWIAYQDKNQELWIYGVESKKTRKVAASKVEVFTGIAWSPDSAWLAYVTQAENMYDRIFLYNLKDAKATALTSDRVYSSSPAWSPDGKWLYFISERHLDSLVSSPWGPRQPEPFFTDTAKIYFVSLLKNGRSPFEPDDELHPGGKERAENPGPGNGRRRTGGSAPAPRPAADTNATAKAGASNAIPPVVIEWDGIQDRVMAAPVMPGNYRGLVFNGRQLYWESQGFRARSKANLMVLTVGNDEPKAKIFAEDIGEFDLSRDGKKLMIRKGAEFYVVDANGMAPAKLEKAVDLRGWSFPLDPREEWRQMFTESWRLMRDYFYDTNMHGVDWTAMLKKYEPLTERITDRAELSDLMGDMVGELSALHTFVTGGDMRTSGDLVRLGGLGALLMRDEKLGGYRVAHVYQTDPDYPELKAPLARPGVDVKEGDVIQSVNGVAALGVPNLGALLRNKSGQQVLLSVKSAGADKPREVIVKPDGGEQELELRYNDWEYSRTKMVEELSHGQIGYVHLRKMGSRDIADWTRQFYPIFNRQGLIVDVRHNGGGNIDSWILEKLMRKAWFFWQPRIGDPAWNMQYAFRGHMVVLCDERTASDGEAFTEGFKRLGLGKAIGTRTWGGEIWLSMDNTLVDKGIASAAEMGVFGPEGKWLIEGHGVDPDIEVDNLPHATFNGEDAQLKAAVTELQRQIKNNPVTVPEAPPHPNKSFK